MQLNILYFAALREALGRSAEAVVAPDTVHTVADLRHWLASRGEPWVKLSNTKGNVRVAVNQTMAQESSLLNDGAEVAFFPPVTGG